MSQGCAYVFHNFHKMVEVDLCGEHVLWDLCRQILY